MKLQIQNDSLRLRLDEAELARLLAGEALTISAAERFGLRLNLGDRLWLETGAPWQVQLPATELRAYAATLPRRDALSFDLGGGLRLDFEVDVRDSRKQRGRPG